MNEICPLDKKACIEHGCVWYRQMFELELDAFGNPMSSSKATPKFECVAVWVTIQLSEIQRRLYTNAATTQALRNDLAATVNLVSKVFELPSSPLNLDVKKRPEALVMVDA